MEIRHAMSTPEETLRAYVAAFESLDPEAIGGFYHAPCLFVSPLGAFPAAGQEAARPIIEAMIGQARSQGYRRTDIRRLAVRPMGGRLAALEGLFVRFDADDREIGRFGFHYVMMETGGRWAIAMAAGFEAPSEESA